MIQTMLFIVTFPIWGYILWICALLLIALFAMAVAAPILAVGAALDSVKSRFARRPQ